MRLMIIDGNAIVHRAYHAIPPLTNSKGVMVNAVYGFASMLLKAWQELKPTHIAVTFDMAGPTFRHVKFEAYKGTRVKADQSLYDQIPLCHEIVSAFGVPIFEKKGYEADDCIGTIVEKIKNQKSKIKITDKNSKIKTDETEIVIVTGDMDTLQLVGGGVAVYALRKGMSDTVLYSGKEVKEKYGFGPEMVVDYKALRGDTSDNIPGVPGVGEKSATELIQKIGGIKEIYQALKKHQLEKEGIKSGIIAKLEAGEKSANMSFELATIDRAVPELNFDLAECAIKDFDREMVIKSFSEFGFNSLVKRIPGMAGAASDEPKKTKAKKEKSNFVFEEIKNKNEVEELILLIKKSKTFGAQVVTTGGDVMAGAVAGIIFVCGGIGYLVPAGLLKNAYEIFADKNLSLVGHDLKQLVKAVELAGVEIKCELFDAMVASYLLAPGTRAHSAGAIILEHLGRETPVSAGQPGLFGVNFQALAEELSLVLQCEGKLRAELIRTDNLGLLQKMEMPLLVVLAEMELNGIAVDSELLQKLSIEIKTEIEKITKKIYKMAGMEFNISSPLQLREVLFEKLEIPVEGIKKGKTGLSTSAEQLEKMKGLHPIIDEIGDYRELTKLQNTYVDVLPTLINKNTGRIHTTYNQTVAATGRLSSSDPNLQNIPIRSRLGKEIRRAFIAEEGNILVSADYAQIELRIVASLAEDKALMKIFEQGEDVHKATAAIINGVKLENVTPEMRRAAKEINFGVLYGMGSYGLAWRAEISHFEAKDFIKKYFEKFAGVKTYIDRTIEFAKKAGYCETLFGRRRYLPELNSPNFQVRSQAERMAVNHPIQGTQADLIKNAMIEVSRCLPLFEGENKRGSVRLLLQVHDELVLEVKKGIEETIGEEVKKIMSEVVKLRVPIEVAVHSGKRWGDLK
ncbi:MAG: DNA polymerase I [bacterium]|nr:DNA polymerase I [bacterium]